MKLKRLQSEVLRVRPAATALYITTCTCTYNKTRSLATITNHVSVTWSPQKLVILLRDNEGQRKLEFK